LAPRQPEETRRPEGRVEPNTEEFPQLDVPPEPQRPANRQQQTGQFGPPTPPPMAPPTPPPMAPPTPQPMRPPSGPPSVRRPVPQQDQDSTQAHPGPYVDDSGYHDPPGARHDPDLDPYDDELPSQPGIGNRLMPDRAPQEFQDDEFPAEFEREFADRDYADRNYADRDYPDQQYQEQDYPEHDADASGYREFDGASEPEPARQPDRMSPGREWLMIAVQVAVGALGGAAVWLGFSWLWGLMPVAAVAAAVIVVAGLVFVVRKLRRAEDLQTTVLAVLVGLVVTVSPAALLLLKR
jgi:hypothetical protein